METHGHGHTDESHDNTDIEISQASKPEISNINYRAPREHVLRESIVGPAWDLVMSTSFIKKFNFFPSLLSTIYLGCIILYQLAYSYVYIFQLKDQFFALIIQWAHTSYFWQVIGALVIGIILYVFITPIAE